MLEKKIKPVALHVCVTKNAVALLFIKELVQEKLRLKIKAHTTRQVFRHIRPIRQEVKDYGKSFKTIKI